MYTTRLARWLFLGSSVAFAAERPEQVFSAIRANNLGLLRQLPASDLEVTDRQGSTPLMHAAAFGSFEALQILIDKGAAVNARNSLGSTALLRGACDQRKSRLLIDKGADVNAPSNQGRTPLIVAARRDGNSATVALMLARGADAKVVDKLGVTALHQAADAGDVDSMGLLIDNGADVNALDKKGDSPLFEAAGLGSLPAVQLLLSKGARVATARTAYAKVRHGQVNLLGLTPLMHAAPYGSPRLVRKLLDAGAGVNARDGRGMTALMLAVASEHQNVEVARLLLNAGSDVNATSDAGESALDWALKFGNPDVIAALRKAGCESRAAQSAKPTFTMVTRREPVDAVKRGIDLLQRSSAEFFRESGCVGCHHQPTTAAAVHAVRRAGLPFDNTLAAAGTEVLVRGWQLSADEMLQGIRRGGGSERIVNQLLAIHDADAKPDMTSDAALADVASLQHQDGSWLDQYEARPPMTDSRIARTAYAVRALKVRGWPGRQAEFDQRVLRARTFLLASKAVTGDDHALLLLGLVWSQAQAGEIRKAADRLIAIQKPDGGWAGNRYLASDAFTTGEALVGLRESGLVKTSDPAYRRGVDFLLNTQFPDGSWYVRSRSPKFQPYFQSGFPFDHDQWISAAATGWAVQAIAGIASAPATQAHAR